MSSITVNVERTITFPTVIEASQEFIDLFLNVLKTQSIEKIDSINNFLIKFTERYNQNPTRFYFKTFDHSSGDTTEYDLHIYTWTVDYIHNNITMNCVLDNLHVKQNLVEGTSSICCSSCNKQSTTTSFNYEMNTQVYVNCLPADVNTFYLGQATAIGTEVVNKKLAL